MVTKLTMGRAINVPTEAITIQDVDTGRSPTASQVNPQFIHLQLKNVVLGELVRTITALRLITIAYLIYITIGHQKMLAGGKVNGSFTGNWKSRNEFNVTHQTHKI